MQTELQATSSALAERNVSYIHIDLLRQQPDRLYTYRKYFKAAAVAVTIVCFYLLYLEFTWLNLGLFALFLLQVYNLFCVLSGIDPLIFVFGTNYLTLNKKGITFKRRKQKPVKIDWDEVDNITVHLFAVHFNLKNDDQIAIDLSDLTDENLEKVKSRLHLIKQKWQV